MSNVAGGGEKRIALGSNCENVDREQTVDERWRGI